MSAVYLIILRRRITEEKVVAVRLDEHPSVDLVDRVYEIAGSDDRVGGPWRETLSEEGKHGFEAAPDEEPDLDLTVRS